MKYVTDLMFLITTVFMYPHDYQKILTFEFVTCAFTYLIILIVCITETYVNCI